MKDLLTRKAVLAKGATMAYLAPKLAQDAKLDLTPIFIGVTGKNFAERKPAIVTALKSATTGKLAQDADIEDVAKLLDALESVDEPEGQDTSTMTAPNSGTPYAELKEKIKDRLSDDEMAALDAICAGKAMDESDEDKRKREDAEREKAAKDEEAKKDMVTKPAMDAAISAAVAKVRETERGIQAALRDVRPRVGELVPKKGMAFDSAEDVYRTALGAMGVTVEKIEDVPLHALKAIYASQPKQDRSRTTSLAMDAAGVKSFSERFPEAARITTVS